MLIQHELTMFATWVSLGRSMHLRKYGELLIKYLLHTLGVDSNQGDVKKHEIYSLKMTTLLRFGSRRMMWE